jgi:hypothetical protein
MAAAPTRELPAYRRNSLWIERRGRDSNPRWTKPPIPVFESGSGYPFAAVFPGYVALAVPVGVGIGVGRAIWALIEEGVDHCGCDQRMPM